VKRLTRTVDIGPVLDVDDDDDNLQVDDLVEDPVRTPARTPQTGQLPLQRLADPSWSDSQIAVDELDDRRHDARRHAPQITLWLTLTDAEIQRLDAPYQTRPLYRW
jgi:hypothetical protein